MGSPGGPRHGVTPATGVAAVRAALGPVPPRAAVVLAVSGGRDSVGMACLVTAARPDLRPSVGHVRHGLRNDAADAAAAEACAAALSLPCRVVAVDVVADGTGPENAARMARLSALDAMARDAGAAYVLTGHTAEDQAETALLNLARGAGLGGLAGIPPLRGLSAGVQLLRPVLGLRRAAVRAAAAAAGLPVVDDPTNDDPRQPRAIARSQLLPLLAQLTGGGSDPVISLARLAGHARSEVAALDSIARVLAEHLVSSWAGVVVAPSDDLDALPAAVAVRVLREMAARAGGDDALPQTAVEALRRLGDGKALSLPGGMVASRGGGWVAVAMPALAGATQRVGEGSTTVPDHALELVAERGSITASLPPWAPALATATVSVPDLGRLAVRRRLPGDRITTAAGTQTLADAMISAAVPRIARDRLPVVVDDAGPLWVPGVAVRAATAGPWHLRLQPLGAGDGPGDAGQPEAGK